MFEIFGVITSGSVKPQRGLSAREGRRLSADGGRQQLRRWEQGCPNQYARVCRRQPVPGGLAATGVTCTNPGTAVGKDGYSRICFLESVRSTALASFVQQDKISAEKAYLLEELGSDCDQDFLNCTAPDFWRRRISFLWFRRAALSCLQKRRKI